MLYVIPTPIGNKDDITLRALDLLRSLGIFLCEDTRTCKDLLRLYAIPFDDKKFYSLTSYTTDLKYSFYLDLVKENDVGLVSEAGTPCFSDPGKTFLLACQEAGIPFTVLPGANALVPAVVAAWFPTHTFQFLWFLPTKKGRKTTLEYMLSLDIPVFFYESVHRVEKLFHELSTYGFKGKISIAREISKMFEQYITGTLEEMQYMLKQKKLPLKGEFVIGLRNNTT